MLFSSFSITGWFYFSAKLRTPFCNWVAKEGKGIAAAKHGLKIQQSHAPERWPYSLRVRGPHFASKVSYKAGAATDDYVGQCKTPLRGRCRLFANLIFMDFEHPTFQGQRRNPKSFARLRRSLLPAAAIRATRGRRSCYSRPRFVLLAAASR